MREGLLVYWHIISTLNCPVKSVQHFWMWCWFHPRRNNPYSAWFTLTILFCLSVVLTNRSGNNIFWLSRAVILLVVGREASVQYDYMNSTLLGPSNTFKGEWQRSKLGVLLLKRSNLFGPCNNGLATTLTWLEPQKNQPTYFLLTFHCRAINCSNYNSSHDLSFGEFFSLSITMIRIR